MIRLPLTNSQTNIWLGQLVHPESGIYNLPHVFQIRGEIDVEKFRNCFQQVIDRNELLRSVIGKDENDIPYQEILPEYRFDLPFVEVRDEGDFRKRIESLQPITDLSKPGFYSTLYQVGDQYFSWFLNVHHLLLDATTFKDLYDQMVSLYWGKEIDDSADFGEYVEFESQSRVALTPSYSYWREKEKSITPLSFFGKRSKGTTEARRLKVPLSDSIKKQLFEKLSQGSYRSLNKDMTLFPVMASFLYAFLYKITQNNELRIGTLLANRNNPKFRKTPGLLIELLPADVQIDEDETFLSLFNKVRAELFENIKHTYPGAQSVSGAKGIHAVLNYLPFKFQDFGEFPSTIEWIHSEHIDKDQQIRVQVYDYNNLENLDIYLDLKTELFESKFEEVTKQFGKVIEAFLEDDQNPLSRISLSTDKDIENQLERSKPIFYSCVPKLSESLQKAFKSTTNAIAVVDGDHSLTYEELSVEIDKVASTLLQKGVEEGDRVVINLDRSKELVTSILAVLKLNASFVPIPHNFPRERISHILSTTNAKLIISDNSWLAKSSDKVIDSNSLVSDVQESIEWKEKAEYTESYVLFTSGSTGKPKGVQVKRESLANYLHNCLELYTNNEPLSMPLFTSIGFDLTLTSIFLPIVTGGTIEIFPAGSSVRELSILDVAKSNRSNAIKLTPSHAQLLIEESRPAIQPKVMILGGEELSTSLASDLTRKFGKNLKIFNEYGPTEGTIGCIVAKYDSESTSYSVPIGKPMKGTGYLVLDEGMNIVPTGVPGQLYLKGINLAYGYLEAPELTAEKFINNPFEENERLYQTGDQVRLDDEGNLDYIGRVDRQLKVNGIRFEPQELEKLILEFPGIKEAHVVYEAVDVDRYQEPHQYCTNCGLPSNYPDISFDENGVCHLCNSFDNYKEKVKHYFRDMDALKERLDRSRRNKTGEYDCLALLSGGKDSTYVLAQLKEMGMNILAFTLDNGFISDQAKANIDRVVQRLEVDHIYGKTDKMNEIFIDSIRRYDNVCNGCFKTVYTLSTQLALQKGIPTIVTGLSRGQFFETRLTEELFVGDKFMNKDLDETILEARKAYHRVKDAVSDNLDVSMFENDDVFEKVEFLDFYRYCDVDLTQLYDYLHQIGWQRPADTGRSTNCIINDLGIHIHKRNRGYHNYAFPYSWDVRIGHKTKDEAIDELNDEIDPALIQQLYEDIGLKTADNKTLVVYFTAEEKVDSDKLKEHLEEKIPAQLLPEHFIQLDQFPTNENGKIDLKELSAMNKPKQSSQIIKPENRLEEMVLKIWIEILNQPTISVTDSLFDIGGNSLNAIRILAKVKENLRIELSISEIFENNTIRSLSTIIEKRIKQLLKERESTSN